MKTFSVSVRSVLCGFAVVAATTGVVSAQSTAPDRGYGYYHGPGMMWGSGPFGAFGMLFGAILFILVVIAIIAAVVYLMRSIGVAGTANTSMQRGQSENRALDILRERFAKGEIDAKEFDERKRLLSE